MLLPKCVQALQVQLEYIVRIRWHIDRILATLFMNSKKSARKVKQTSMLAKGGMSDKSQSPSVSKSTPKTLPAVLGQSEDTSA